MKNNCFIKFKNQKAHLLIPDKLNDPFAISIPEICKIATSEVQELLLTNHNSTINKGKMFGVLVVENSHKEIGYLCTFSGKLLNETQSSVFVPSLFDISTRENFLGKGMTELSEIGTKIKILASKNSRETSSEINLLKTERKLKSTLLQEKLFDQYHFLNKFGESKSLKSIFKNNTNRNPASGTGDCAAPKLLQYAYKNNMKPLAIAEFWWGKATKSEDRKHGEFYPACTNKCRPILDYML